LYLKMILRLSNAFLRTAAEKLYGKRPEEGKCHLLGIRSASPISTYEVQTHAPKYDTFDDCVGLWGSAWGLWPGTVDPGSTYTRKPMNAGGTAHLIPGVWRYKFGLHKGKPAFVQAAAVTVRRDKDRDGTAEASEKLDTGMLGVNGHRMGNGGPSVGSWSAGCWGAPEARFKELYALAESSGQSEFQFWLFDGAALEKLIAS
jgi:hypothetical protein